MPNFDLSKDEKKVLSKISDLKEKKIKVVEFKWLFLLSPRNPNSSFQIIQDSLRALGGKNFNKKSVSLYCSYIRIRTASRWHELFDMNGVCSSSETQRIRHDGLLNFVFLKDESLLVLFLKLEHLTVKTGLRFAGFVVRCLSFCSILLSLFNINLYKMLQKLENKILSDFIEFNTMEATN